MVAVVIPAYKDKYLRETLTSLANQSRKDFEVYVGDDNSPYNISSIAEEFRGRLNLHYKKFTENLGGRSLPAHWERCIRMVNDAEWIWFFSDDDFVDYDCIERFYEALDRTQSDYDLYRFNTKVVDRNSSPHGLGSNHPRLETAFQFLQRRLNSETISFAVEYIFKKEIFWKTKGFARFPLAWASDDVTWIKIAERKGIYTIPGSFVYWRYSGDNITSVYQKNRRLKKIASRKFVSWARGWSLRQKNHIRKEQLISWYIKQLGVIGYGGRKQLFLYELPWLCMYFKASPLKIFNLYKSQF